jgi:predicted ATP-dependent endonuclease of OLD family
MKLKELVNFTENKSTKNANQWSIEGVKLGDINLIVGMNTSGKSRLVNVLTNLALTISGNRAPAEGYWKVLFSSDDEKEIEYELHIDDKGMVQTEKLTNVSDGQALLVRDSQNKTIYSVAIKDNQQIEPPDNQLTINVRRDKLEYPVLEELYQWANHLYSFKIANLLPENLAAAPESFSGDALKGGFDLMPTIYASLDSDAQSRLKKNLDKLNFGVENIEVKELENFNLPIKAKFMHWIQRGVKYPIPQFNISNGLLRAFGILLVLEVASRGDYYQTVLIDDVAEGLDYERARILYQILNERKDDNLQIILTSNSQVLMDGIDVKYWNILVRKGSQVKSYNYSNSKKKFDDFESTGLNNFSLFTSDIMQDHA